MRIMNGANVCVEKKLAYIARMQAQHIVEIFRPNGVRCAREARQKWHIIASLMRWTNGAQLKHVLTQIRTQLK